MHSVFCILPFIFSFLTGTEIKIVIQQGCFFIGGNFIYDKKAGGFKPPASTVFHTPIHLFFPIYPAYAMPSNTSSATTPLIS